MAIRLEEALEQLAATREELMDFVRSQDEAALERPGACGTWSVKQVLAHLAAWEAWVLQSLPARLETGRTPEEMRARVQDEDRYNELEVTARAHFSPRDQIAELEQTRFGLVQLLATLDDATLECSQPWAEWQGTVPEYLLAALRDHEREHLEGMRAALMA